MKKVFKLISLFILLLIVNVLTVKADIKVDSYSSAGYFGGDEVLKTKLNVNGTNTTAYCHNPGVTAFTEAEFKNKDKQPIVLIQKRKLGDTKNGRTQNIYDAGLISILTNNNKDNGNTDFSMAKYIAINLYEQLFPMFNSNGNNGSSEIPYLKYIVNTKLYDDIKGDLKTLANNMGSYNVIKAKMSGASKCTDNCGSDSDVNTAVSMVKKALKAAINYAQNGEATTTVGDAVQTRSETKDNKGKVTYKDTASHSISIAAFGDTSNNKGSVYLSFNCANCKNVTTKFYLNDKEVKNLSKINLLDYTNNGTGIVKLKIEFTGNVCEDINYTLTATYTHYSISRVGYSVAKCLNSNKCQGFYVADSSSSTGTKTTTIENKISFCPTPTEISKCTAKIDNVECIECNSNVHEVNITEGYTYPNNNTCDTKGATLDIKKCIANDGAVDTANHTYKNDEYSKDTTKHNAGVYCKEDYTLSMPGSIMVDSNRYFTLNSSIKGTEKCYTNDLTKSKTIASVKADITKHGKSTVDAYNEIQKYKAISECLADSSCYTITTEKKVAKTVPYSGRCWVAATNPEALDSICGEDRSKCKKAATTGNYYVDCTKYMRFYDIRPVITLNKSYSGYVEGTCGTKTYTLNTSVEGEGVFYGDWLGRAVSKGAADIFDCDDNTYCDATVNDLTEEEKAAAVSAIGKQSEGTWTPSGGVGNKVPSGGTWSGTSGYGLSVELGTGTIISDIDGWNSATGYYGGIIGNDFDDTPFDNGWKMSYNFDPDMYFWYQEEYMLQSRTNQMDMYDKSLKDVKAQYCEGTVSDDYKTCSTGWKDVPSVESGSVCVCWGPDAGDCGNKKYVLSKVRYVVQSQEAEAKFITPTQFYSINSSGSVVVADKGKSNEIANGIELTNALPTSPKTIGTRRYVLWFKQLGEYYNKNELGRIWGNADSVVPLLLSNRSKCNNPNSALVSEDNTNGTIHSNGVYACKYTTDCPENNICKTPAESSDGNYHCQNGEKCTEEQYNNQCTNTCANPNIENGKYSYCDNIPQGSENATYQCRKNVTEKQYKVDCPNGGPNPYTCAKPKIENGKYSYCDNIPQGSENATYQCRENVTEKQYKVDCPNGGPNPYTCAKPMINNNGTPNDDSDDKYTYCDNLPYGAEETTYQCRENYTKAQYKTDCCPDGDCPVTTNYVCAVTTKEDNPDKLVYYGKDGQETTEAIYKAQCCPDGDCPVTCTYCLYDGKKLNVQYRPITSEDLNPNDRELGVNWKSDEPIDTTLELKAYETTNEILEDGDTIFDSSDNKKNNTFLMQVEMTPAMTSRIRTLNDTTYNKGYLANTLECYDYDDGTNVYENIYCYSKFLDELINEYGKGSKPKITFASGIERPSSNGRKNANHEKYFTSFATKKLSDWNIKTTRTLEANYNKYGIVIDENGNSTDYHVGPSWK